MLMLISCDQEYNGRYILNECRFKNEKPCELGNTYLQLNWDKTFVLKTEKKVIKGRWDFYDDGDAAILELDNKKSRVEVSKDGRKVIHFFNPHTVFDDDNIGVVEFVKESRK